MSSRNSLCMPRLHGSWPISPPPRPNRPLLPNSFLIVVFLRCLKMRNERLWKQSRSLCLVPKDFSIKISNEAVSSLKFHQLKVRLYGNNLRLVVESVPVLHMAYRQLHLLPVITLLTTGWRIISLQPSLRVRRRKGGKFGRETALEE